MYCSKCGAWASESESVCGRCGAALHIQHALPLTPPVAPSPAPPPLRYCGFWRRFGAALVDLAVCAPFSYAIEIMLGRRPFEPVEWNAEFWGVQSVLMGLSWLYSALLESSRWQGTLGQQLLDIRVADRDGRRVGFGRATGRHFAQLISFLTFGIGYLMIAFTARKQALHDVLSGCVLVRPAPRAVPAPPPPNLAPHALSAAGPVA